MALSNLTRVRGAFDSARQLALTRTAANPRKISRQNHPSKHMCPNLVCILPWPAFIGLERQIQRGRERGRRRERGRGREGDSVGV